MKINKANEKKRTESKLQVQTYLDRLKYAIESGTVKINFQKSRQIDNMRDKKYTNRYTISQLFPNEDEVEVLKKELAYLTVEEYIETVKDIRFPNKSEMRVFGKKYLGEDVYIKIRVELISIADASGNSSILVMSFHFSERDFKKSNFPYGKS
ncbi:hypothetical protein Amet_0866 [Alkaliphilus metalliredigens QYMF]|uniref:Uncharacterized protein n=1 Tax=Alkaliphilus metalliredigens (strain QYMF) TaxID=293826 RepID=A6TLM3_ALKMQ|nr:hypothetical protein [Alkaliphilus metalliredigens]ABR47091.1 hypothetical protein Amet_0866 [Alkaliphilus metalliredigens QYMF]